MFVAAPLVEQEVAVSTQPLLLLKEVKEQDAHDLLQEILRCFLSVLINLPVILGVLREFLLQSRRELVVPLGLGMQLEMVQAILEPPVELLEETLRQEFLVQPFTRLFTEPLYLFIDDLTWECVNCQ